MLKENISLTQLFVLVVCFLLGTSFITGVGKEPMHDGWIAILIATVIGLGIMYFYYTFNQLLPNNNLFEIMEYCFTRPVAIFMSLCYITFFLYIETRIIRTFSALMNTSILIRTPIEMIILMMMFVIIYLVYLGLEVIARVTEVFFPYILGFIIILFLLLFISGAVTLNHIQPILGDGWKPIIKVLYPSLVSYPFGELIVFTVLLSSMPQLKKGRKIMLLGVLTSGLLLTMGAVLLVTTLGAEFAQSATYPMFIAARRVSVGDFIERIEAVVVFIIMFGVLVKATIYLYAGLKGLEYVFRIPYRYFSIPVSIIAANFTILTARNHIEFSFETAHSTFPYILPVMEFAIPFVMMAVLLWKKKFVQNRTKQMEEV